MLERKTPPQGYICHRCKVPGMFMFLIKKNIGCVVYVSFKIMITE